MAKIKTPPEARKALDELNHIISDIYDNGGTYIYLARSNADKKTSLWLIIKQEGHKEINKFADITDAGQIGNLIKIVKEWEHDSTKQM